MISVKNIDKKFGSLHVLKNVSCQIEKGEKVVIIGPSGSGKSTLLRCMNLLESPTGGEIWLEDRMLTDADPYLHPDLLEKTKTFKHLSDAGQEDALSNIAAERLLKKHEGKEYHKAFLSYEAECREDINLARQKMGMVFQHFNLFTI